MHDGSLSHIPIGSVFNTVGSATLFNLRAFDSEKPAYSQVTELFATIMQKVDRNPHLLENVYNFMATHVAGPISVMVNELNRMGGNVAVGGIEEFSKVNDMLPSANKRFKPRYEIAMSTARATNRKQATRNSQSADVIINGTICSPSLGTRYSPFFS